MLLCNIINTLESLNLIFERINDFNLNLNSPVQLFLISFVIISIIVKFSGAFYASNIEIFLILNKLLKKFSVNAYSLLNVTIILALYIASRSFLIHLSTDNQALPIVFLSIFDG